MNEKAKQIIASALPIVRLRDLRGDSDEEQAWLILKELEKAGFEVVGKEELEKLKEEIADCEKSAELRFEIIREADEYWQKILNKPPTQYSDMRQLIKFLMDRIKELEKQIGRKA